MKTREQNKIAAWLDISPSALSNIFSGRRGMSRRTAVKVSAVAGIPFEKLMLGGGDEIKEEVLKAWSDRLEAAQ